MPSSEKRTPSRGGRPRDATVDQRVLPIVREHLIDFGWDGLSVRAVAAESGVARATINRRWATKTELVLHAVLTDQLVLDDDRTAPAGWVENVISQSRMIFDQPVFRSALPGLLAVFEQDPAARNALWTTLAGPAAIRFAEHGSPERREQAEIDALAMIVIAAGSAMFASVVADDMATDAVRTRINELLHLMENTIIPS